MYVLCYALIKKIGTNLRLTRLRTHTFYVGAAVRAGTQERSKL